MGPDPEAPRRPTPAARLYRWLTERLYRELAFLYDPVSWLVSLGRWDAWRRGVLPFLGEDPILEIGFGTGALLATLAGRGRRAVGIDPSPAMHRRAARRLARGGWTAPRLQGIAQALPFADRAFGTAVATFPTDWVFAPEAWREVDRVLRPDGPFLLVGVGLPLEGPGITPWVERLLGVTGREVWARLEAAAEAAGRTLSVRETTVDGTAVRVIVARRGG